MTNFIDKMNSLMMFRDICSSKRNLGRTEDGENKEVTVDEDFRSRRMNSYLQSGNRDSMAENLSYCMVMCEYVNSKGESNHAVISSNKDMISYFNSISGGMAFRSNASKTVSQNRKSGGITVFDFIEGKYITIFPKSFSITMGGVIDDENRRNFLKFIKAVASLKRK